MNLPEMKCKKKTHIVIVNLYLSKTPTPSVNLNKN